MSNHSAAKESKIHNLSGYSFVTSHKWTFLNGLENKALISLPIAS